MAASELAANPQVPSPLPPPEWSFSAPTGFFTHDNDPTDWSFRSTTQEGFGLIPRQYSTDGSLNSMDGQTQWQRFTHHLTHLNQDAPKNVRFKVFFLSRHGEAVHNVVEKEVGRDAWNSHYSRLSSYGEHEYADAELTSRGVTQAVAASAHWVAATDPKGQHKMSWPSIYSSPLRRCLQTTRTTFASIASSHGVEFKPKVRELLRERNGVQPCNRRSSKAWIQEHYGEFEVEEAFSEGDELWTADALETDEDMAGRARRVLGGIFESDGSELVVLVSHALFLRAVMKVAGYKVLPLDKASVVPILVRGEKMVRSE